MGPIGDPIFGAIEDIAGAAAFGPEPHRHDIRAGAGFRHGERADMLAADQPGQIGALLLIRSPAANLVDAQV